MRFPWPRRQVSLYCAEKRRNVRNILIFIQVFSGPKCKTTIPAAVSGSVQWR